MGRVRRKGGAVRIELVEAEVALLANLAGQVRDLLTDGLPEGSSDANPDPLQELIGLRTSDATTPADPILARLLPDAYRDDDAAAGEYRRLMDADLRLQKSSALQHVLDDLASADVVKTGDNRIELSDEAAERWLYALTDVRLTLGTVLGVTEDLEDELAAGTVSPERAGGLSIYDWVTWLQDALVGAAAT